jgi:RNA polymerase sigma-70 factor (ECF subfamily)
MAIDTDVPGPRTRDQVDTMGVLHLAQQPAPTDPERDRLAAIYRDHAGFVARSLRHLGVAELHLDDLVQDVFLVVHRRLRDFDGRGPLRAWLYGIARGVAANYRRGRVRTHRRLELVQASTPSEERMSDQVEAVQLVEQFLAGLKEIHREIFILSEIEGLSGPEIAEALGLNLNTVYARVRKTRRLFEQRVSQQEGAR